MEIINRGTLKSRCLTGGAPQGGQGGRPPPQLEHWGGIAPPQLWATIQRGAYKSPLLSLFCNSVYWLKPHNNVNSRPPNLAVLPPPLPYSLAHNPHMHQVHIVGSPDMQTLPDLQSKKVACARLDALFLCHR